MNRERVEVSICIVSYNTRDLLLACVESIKQNTHSISYEIIVTDNASHDGSPQALLEAYPDVIVIQNRENAGFAHATNQAIKAAIGDYALLLNPDTVILDGAIEKSLRFLKSQNHRDAATCRVLNPDGTVQRIWKGKSFYLLRAQFLMSTRLERFFPDSPLLEQARLAHFNPSITQTIDFAAGCFILIRRDNLITLGLLDEDYFLFSEDSDLCFRIRMQGGLIHYFAGAEIIHYGGQSTKPIALQAHHQFIENRYRFYKKNMGQAQAAAFRGILALGAGMKLVKLLATRPFSGNDAIRQARQQHLHTLKWSVGLERSRKPSGIKKKKAESRKKVLIIAYHFPPENIIGALRPMGLAKYLRNFGWEPIILTRQLLGQSRDYLKKHYTIVEVPSFDISILLRKLLGISTPVPSSRSDDYATVAGASKIKTFVKHLIKTIFAFPDKENGWYFHALKAAPIIFSEHHIDCILSTSSPWTTAIIARRLKVKYGVPWLADFRDLWTQHHRYDYLFPRRQLERVLEKWTLKMADVMTTVSDRRAQKWQLLHPGKRIVPITLGFDPEDFESSPARRSHKKFLITHAGKVKGRQDPGPLFRALAELIQEGEIARDGIEVRFWGEMSNSARDVLHGYGLEGVVKNYPSIPRAEMLEKEMESHLLLVLTWNDACETGIHPGKLFDYLGARVPILAVGEYPDVVTEVLAETNSGVHFHNNHHGLKAYLKKAYGEVQRNGSVSYKGDEQRVNQYSYENIAGKFAMLLHDITQTKRN